MSPRLYSLFISLDTSKYSYFVSAYIDVQCIMMQICTQMDFLMKKFCSHVSDVTTMVQVSGTSFVDGCLERRHIIASVNLIHVRYEYASCFIKYMYTCIYIDVVKCSVYICVVSTGYA